MKIITTVRDANDTILHKSSHFGEWDPIFPTSRLEAMRATIKSVVRSQ